MADLADNGNILISDHVVIRDTETKKVILSTRGHKNNPMMNNKKKDEDKQ